MPYRASDSPIGPDHPLRRLFSGMVEQVFMVELGICDPKLTDYMASILTDFVHVDQIFRLRNVDGTAIREVSRMEAEAQLGLQAAGTQRTATVYRYIGDFTLFWTGLYPEALRLRSGGADRLTEYVLQGKRSYGIASELVSADQSPSQSLLRDLSERFEHCVHGLHLVRGAWSAGGSRHGDALTGN